MPSINIIDFLADPEWDTPFVKKLAQYETPEGRDHISGFNVRQKFVENFPHLSSDDVNNENPTNEKWLKVDNVGHYVETNQYVITFRQEVVKEDLNITQYPKKGCFCRRSVGHTKKNRLSCDHYRFILLKDDTEKSAVENVHFTQSPLL